MAFELMFRAKFVFWKGDKGGEVYECSGRGYVECWWSAVGCWRAVWLRGERGVGVGLLLGGFGLSRGVRRRVSCLDSFDVDIDGG